MNFYFLSLALAPGNNGETGLDSPLDVIEPAPGLTKGVLLVQADFGLFGLHCT